MKNMFEIDDQQKKFRTNQNEWELLKIYLAKDQQGTIHNLLIACKYFQSTKQGDKLQELLNRVKNLNAEEFASYIKQLSFC